MDALIVLINHFVNFDFLIGFILGGVFSLIGCFIFYKNERNFFKNERALFLEERKQNQEALQLEKKQYQEVLLQEKKQHQEALQLEKEALLIERKQHQEVLLMQQERYEREIKRLDREIATLLVNQGAGIVKP